MDAVVFYSMLLEAVCTSKKLQFHGYGTNLCNQCIYSTSVSINLLHIFNGIRIFGGHGIVNNCVLNNNMYLVISCLEYNIPLLYRERLLKNFYPAIQFIGRHSTTIFHTVCLGISGIVFRNAETACVKYCGISSAFLFDKMYFTKAEWDEIIMTQHLSICSGKKNSKPYFGISSLLFVYELGED